MNKPLFITINAVLLGLLGLYVGLFFLLKSSYHSDEWFIRTYTPIIRLSLDEPIHLNGQVYEGWILPGEICIFLRDHHLQDVLNKKSQPLHHGSIFLLDTRIPPSFKSPKYIDYIHQSGYQLFPYKAKIEMLSYIKWDGNNYLYIYTAKIIGFTDELCRDFIEQLHLNSEEQSP